MLKQHWIARSVDEKKDDLILKDHKQVPFLQNFMAQQWAKNSDEVFNGQELVVTYDTINELIDVVYDYNYGSLTAYTEAPFLQWGEHKESHIEEIEHAVNEAYEALDRGYKVIYTCNW
jgi:hypothetical protein